MCGVNALRNNSEPICTKKPENMLGGEIDMRERAERLWLRDSTAGEELF